MIDKILDAATQFGIGPVIILAIVFSFLGLIVLAILLTKFADKNKESNETLRAHEKSNIELAESVKENFGNLVVSIDNVVNSSYLSTAQSLTIFRLFVFKHTADKCKFILDILDNNDLANREKEIKENIKSKFISITAKDTGAISEFKSVCGDLGQITQENIDWEELFQETFEIVFSKNTKKQKMYDLERKMDQYITKIEDKIRVKGSCNE